VHHSRTARLGVHDGGGGEESDLGVVFSDTGVGATLGGSNADCSYAGEIAEVLIFDSFLSDTEAWLVSTYLSSRLGIEPHSKPPKSTDQEDNFLVSGTTGLKVRAFPPSQSSMPEGNLRGSSPVVAPSASAETLNLLAQMEVLKAQLDSLMQAQQNNDQKQQQAPSPYTHKQSHFEQTGHAVRSEPAQNLPGTVPAKSHFHPGPAQRDPASRRASPVQQTPNEIRSVGSGSRGGKGHCSGGDAFAAASVEGWSPPASLGAELEDLQQWEDASKEAFEAIAHFDKGGKSLREFIHTQVNSLKVLRHKLFCRYVV
jgi:hypothetical protein